MGVVRFLEMQARICHTMYMLSAFIDQKYGVVNPAILTRVQRVAARQHAARDILDDFAYEVDYLRRRKLRDDDFYKVPARALVEEIAKRRDYPVCRGGANLVTVNEVNVLPEPAYNAVLTVDVTYDHDGGMAGALYGVTANGEVHCWAN